MSNLNSPNRLLQNIVKDAFESKSLASNHPIDDEDLLLRWAGHQLSEEERAELLSHLARCSDCRKAVAEMIKNGILEFHEKPAEAPRPLAAEERKKSFYSKTWLMGVLMTSTLCLLFCFTFFPGTIELPTTTHGPGFRGASGDSDKFALLIGINKYGKLQQSEWLDGCHNDIAAMKSVLTERFGFAPEDIMTLLDGQATAAGIREQMKQLTALIQSRPQNAKPAQVLFYFSGHGSRVPDAAGEDGFGASLVVYDSERQGSGIDIPSAELNQFSHDICKDGKAELVIALDSCHSGGGARSIGAHGITKFRGLTRTGERPAAAKLPPRNLPEGMVFLSACQSNQVEPEYEADGKKYGLFTYHLTRLLQTEQLVSSLDYETLKDLIHRSYQRDKVAQAPTPTVDGSPQALRKSFLGADDSVDRKPYWEVEREKERSTVRMKAGKINDITEHSLFELYETAEEALDPTAKSVGWFRITKVDGNYSLGEFFRWKDENQSEQIDMVVPNDFKEGFAVKRYHDYGDNVLAVRVVNAATGKTVAPNDPAIPETMRSALRGGDSKNESAWIRWTAAGEACDLVVKYDEKAKMATVFPATGSADDDREPPKTRGGVTIPETLRGGWGSTDNRPVEWGTEKGKTDLTDIFRQVMRAMSLKRLVAEKAPLKTRGEESSQKLITTVFRCDVDGGNLEPVIVNPRKGIVVEGGEDAWYQIRVKNNDEKKVYVTILCIDPNMQIQALPFGPESDQERFDPEDMNRHRDANRLEPGQEFVSIFDFKEPFGAHTLIVLATRESSDFSNLSQEGLTQTRTKGSASQILEFIEEQCHIGIRAAGRRPVPRDDSWSVGAVDVISVP